jgi:putative ABC transport system substrate-binding protein
MRRRDFLALTAWIAAPLPAGAQELVHTIGFLSSVSAGGTVPASLAAFHQGLKDPGFVEGRNPHVEYRFTDRYDRLPSLTTQLVGRGVAACEDNRVDCKSR